MGIDLKLQELIEQNQGVIKTAQALEIGAEKAFFYQYVRDNQLERIAHGVYATADAWVDSLYVLHLRSAQAIFSHESALLLHDMTDREPPFPSITVRTGYNPSRLAAEGIQVYTVKKSLHGIGRTTAVTAFGHAVPVYDVERTLCDIVRSRNRLEYQVFQGALKAYVRRVDKQLNRLMRYAALFKVEAIVREYLEVLL